MENKKGYKYTISVSHSFNFSISKENYVGVVGIFADKLWDALHDFVYKKGCDIYSVSEEELTEEEFDLEIKKINIQIQNKIFEKINQ